MHLHMKPKYIWICLSRRLCASTWRHYVYMCTWLYVVYRCLYYRQTLDLLPFFIHSLPRMTSLPGTEAEAPCNGTRINSRHTKLMQYCEQLQVFERGLEKQATFIEQANGLCFKFVLLLCHPCFKASLMFVYILQWNRVNWRISFLVVGCWDVSVHLQSHLTTCICSFIWAEFSTKMHTKTFVSASNKTRNWKHGWLTTHLKTGANLYQDLFTALLHICM